MSVKHPDFGKALSCSCQSKKAPPTHEIPLRFQTCTFNNFDVTWNPQMQEALATTKELVAEKRKLVFLYGDRGLGKTHLLCSAVMSWRQLGGGAQFWEVPELLSYLRSTFDREKNQPGLDFEIEQLCKPDFLLALDEIGAHNKTEWAEEQLFRILNRRYAEFAPTILTSNVPVKEIDSRVRSRFREGFVYCEGEDVRGGKA